MCVVAGWYISSLVLTLVVVGAARSRLPEGADLLVHSSTELLGVGPSYFRRISGICWRVEPCGGWISDGRASSPSMDLHDLHAPMLLASGSGSKEIELMYM